MADKGQRDVVVGVALLVGTSARSDFQRMLIVTARSRRLRSPTFVKIFVIRKPGELGVATER